MKLLVYMRDGRTCYALTGRGQLAALFSERGKGPAHERPSIEVVRGIWNPHTGAYLWQPGVRLRFIARGSIAFVEEGDPNRAAVGQV